MSSHRRDAHRDNRREPRDPRDARDVRDVRDARETRDPRDPRDVRDPRDAWDPRDSRDPRDLRDPRDPRDATRYDLDQGDIVPRRAEYFVPGDGISREVIQADICRYLGPDALIKPMEYNGVRGYMVKAYRPFTSEMIADLKQDSVRWQAERDQTDARGYGADYTQSVTHRSRQYYGFSGQAQQPPQMPQMPPGAPVSQGGPAQAAFASYGLGDYTYAQTSGPYQQAATAYAYPSPLGTEYELPSGPSREPRQAYPYGALPPGGTPNRNVVTDPEASANYYYATQGGQPMPSAGRGQPYLPAQSSYSQPPPRETHPSRDEPSRRRRER